MTKIIDVEMDEFTEILNIWQFHPLSGPNDDFEDWCKKMSLSYVLNPEGTYVEKLFFTEKEYLIFRLKNS